MTVIRRESDCLQGRLSKINDTENSFRNGRNRDHQRNGNLRLKRARKTNSARTNTFQTNVTRKCRQITSNLSTLVHHNVCTFPTHFKPVLQLMKLLRLIIVTHLWQFKIPPNICDFLLINSKYNTAILLIADLCKFCTPILVPTPHKLWNESRKL